MPKYIFFACFPYTSNLANGITISHNTEEDEYVGIINTKTYEALKKYNINNNAELLHLLKNEGFKAIKFLEKDGYIGFEQM
ncbi:hypothetical protein H6G04_18295 [Calothrix membranacea FACHB-236]|nr:hypothetical protein [Calothrix membranacea FACHB-236]